jgi:hypothetical protein
MTEFKRNQLLTQHLANYITDHKKEFVAQVLDQRTRHVTVLCWKKSFNRRMPAR